jgi:hypothetical protein
MTKILLSLPSHPSPSHLRSTQVWATLLDRKQQELRLVAIPLQAFGMTGSTGSPDDVVTLLIDHSDIWINATATPTFLGNSNPHDARFLWQSERSGFMHVEAVHAVAGQGVSLRSTGHFLLVRLNVSFSGVFAYNVGAPHFPAHRAHDCAHHLRELGS